MYRESRAANINVHGCLHVLLLIYIDVVRSPMLVVPKGVPRFKHVTTKMLETLDTLDMKVSGLHGKLHVVFAGIEGSIVNADDLSDEEDDPTIKDGTTPLFGELAVLEMAEDLKASIERIEMEYMLAKAQVEKERMSKIAQLDKKRRADMLVLLGGCRQSGINTGKPPQRSSLDAAANPSDRPPTSRQGDTLTVSNNDDRLLSSSRDLELATAHDLNGAARPKPQDDGQGEGQENQIKEKSGSPRLHGTTQQ